MQKRRTPTFLLSLASGASLAVAATTPGCAQTADEGANRGTVGAGTDAAVSGPRLTGAVVLPSASEGPAPGLAPLPSFQGTMPLPSAVTGTMVAPSSTLTPPGLVTTFFPGSLPLPSATQVIAVGLPIMPSSTAPGDGGIIPIPGILVRPDGGTVLPVSDAGTDSGAPPGDGGPVFTDGGAPTL